jgi:hypothetical protein
MNDPAYVRDKKSTPKSKRGLAASDPGEALWMWAKGCG